MQKQIPRQIRYLLTSWLLAVTLEYLLLSGDGRALAGLEGLQQMSGIRVLLITVFLLAGFNLLHRFKRFRCTERWWLLGAVAVYAVCAVISSFSWAFCGVCVLLLLTVTGYCIYGWNDSNVAAALEHKQKKAYIYILIGIAAAVFFCIVSAWTVARVRSFCAPTFDFGIFSQMFHNMKETGLPMTTVERDGLLSHFAVHVSPIYYLMLPFYCLVPRPETLQVLQAAVLASAVIPLWKLGRHHGLHPVLRFLLCLLLLLYPAYAGGASYDLHENCFLTPLILWLLYGLDKKNIPLTAVFAVLTLTVKEDAAVYVAVVALYVLLRSALHREKWGLIAGASVLIGAVAWFVGAAAWLSGSGDGVMSYRYNNLIYDGSGSLLTVVKAVLLCPIKAVYECVDAEKLKYIAVTMLPLLGLPFITRRYERLVLLIPYILVNLMSDYKYQHDIMFQYSYGSAACLFYLIAVNVADMKVQWKKLAAMTLACCIGFCCFYEKILPEVQKYVSYCEDYEQYYENQRQLLDTIPEGVSVASTTYYTVHLSRRAELYDIRYCTREHVLSCEYVVIKVSEANTFKSYATDGKNGKENFVAMLLENGYRLESEVKGVTEIYKKQ